MALNATRLSASLESGVRAAVGLGSTSYPQLTAYMNAIATAIVNEITGHAAVAITTPAQNAVVTTSGSPPVTTAAVVTETINNGVVS